MRIHYFQHVPFEGLGSIAGWTTAQHHAVTATRLYAGDPLPIVAEIDWLVVMGGPMGVHDERELPWLVDEKRVIGNAIHAGKSVLGVCLGAQLIADVLGARVYRNQHREIGWFPIELTAAGMQSALGQAIGGVGTSTQPLAPSPRFDVFHWHGDTFDLPVRATHLARSAACEQQGFSIEDRIIGLQFHLETTPETAATLIQNCPDDLAEGRYVQSAAEMLDSVPRFATANAIMTRLLDALSGAPKFDE